MYNKNRHLIEQISRLDEDLAHQVQVAISNAQLDNKVMKAKQALQDSCDPYDFHGDNEEYQNQCASDYISACDDRRFSDMCPIQQQELRMGA